MINILTFSEFINENLNNSDIKLELEGFDDKDKNLINGIVNNFFQSISAEYYNEFLNISKSSFDRHKKEIIESIQIMLNIFKDYLDFRIVHIPNEKDKKEDVIKAPLDIRWGGEFNDEKLTVEIYVNNDPYVEKLFKYYFTSRRIKFSENCSHNLVKYGGEYNITFVYEFFD